MTAAPPAPASRAKRVRALAALVLAALAAAVALGAGRVSGLDEAWFDALQRAWPRPVQTLPVTIVEIDDRSLAKLGRWPWPRTQVADLVAKVAAQGVGAIGIDVVLPEPDALSPRRALAALDADPVLRERIAALPSNDDVLARALEEAPAVLAMVSALEPTTQPLRAAPIRVHDAQGDAASGERAVAKLLAYPAALSSLEALTAAADGWGLVSAEDTQGVVRSVPLVANVHGTLVPGFAVDMWRVAARARSIVLATRDGVARDVRIGRDAFAVDADGTARPWFSPHRPDRFVSAVDVLEGHADPQALRTTFALIGVTGLALGDYVWTPSGKMPGVEVHAQLLETMYARTFLARPRFATLGEAGALMLAGALLIALPARWPVRYGVLLAVALGAAMLALAALAFREQRLLLDAATPAVALAMFFAMLTALELADATRQRKALQQALQREREAAARIAGELDAARRIQLDTLPRADGVRDPRVELAAAMEPALEVGGDLYDFYLLDAGRLFFMLGDVAGKGLSASIFMAVSKALCKSTMLRASEADLGAWLAQANREVGRDNPAALFVTAFAGVLDLATGVLVYCNAGHENPWLRERASGRVTRLADGGGPPLCVLDDFPYAAAEVRLAPGDVVCIVSDGVTEASARNGSLYGAARVAATLADESSAGAALAAIRDDVQRFTLGAEQSDDISVLALCWRGG